MKSVVVLCILLPILGLAVGECPPPELLGPCECHLNPDGDSALMCSQIESADELIEVFQGLQLYESFDSVDILNSPQLTKLAESLFGDLAISAIRFYNTGIQDVPNGVFSPMTAQSLETLYIKHNKDLSHIDKELIVSLTGLQSLYASFNGITALKGTSTGSTVEYLDLGHNMITEISQEFFFADSKVSFVLLGFNSLTSESLTMDSLAFNNVGESLYLDLGWNQLTEGIPVGAFRDLYPKELILSGNSITDLEEDWASPLMAAMLAAYGEEGYILLDNNHLECSCAMQWVVGHSGKSLLREGQCKDGRLVDSLTDADFSHC